MPNEMPRRNFLYTILLAPLGAGFGAAKGANVEISKTKEKTKAEVKPEQKPSDDKSQKRQNLREISKGVREYNQRNQHILKNGAGGGIAGAGIGLTLDEMFHYSNTLEAEDQEGF